MARTRQWAALLLLALSVGACRARTPCDGVACAPACPRDSAPDAAGRCVCIPGNVRVLGSCVPPEVGDLYCGPAARIGIDGCVFRACSDGALLDAVTGACVSKATLPEAGFAPCGEGGAPIVAQGRVFCVGADAVCPRGTDRAGSVCSRPPSCPPGALVAGRRCQSVVTVNGRGSLPRVDLGAWAAIVLGPDGGPGTPDLCRPLALRPDAFGLTSGAEGTVGVDISLFAPDQDLARVHSTVRVTLVNLIPAAAPQPTSTSAETVATASVRSLIEPLRGLGGEASTGAMELKVRCRVKSL